MAGHRYLPALPDLAGNRGVGDSPVSRQQEGLAVYERQARSRTRPGSAAGPSRLPGGREAPAQDPRQEHRAFPCCPAFVISGSNRDRRRWRPEVSAHPASLPASISGPGQSTSRGRHRSGSWRRPRPVGRGLFRPARSFEVYPPEIPGDRPGRLIAFEPPGSGGKAPMAPGVPHGSVPARRQAGHTRAQWYSRGRGGFLQMDGTAEHLGNREPACGDF